MLRGGGVEIMGGAIFFCFGVAWGQTEGHRGISIALTADTLWVGHIVYHIISQTFAMAPINQSSLEPHITNTIVVDNIVS